MNSVSRYAIVCATFLSILTSTLPAPACKPAPGVLASSISQKIRKAPFVFEGKVTSIQADKLTVTVNRYFKQGSASPKIVTISGFNTTSCDDNISTLGERYLFFAAPDKDGMWYAVYDGAYGSSRPWDKQAQKEVKQFFKIK